jgi:hypothetical protein
LDAAIEDWQDMEAGDLGVDLWRDLGVDLGGDIWGDLGGDPIESESDSDVVEISYHEYYNAKKRKFM